MRVANAVVEGRLDESVLRAIVRHFEIDIERVIVKGGRTSIAAKAFDYYQSSAGFPWMILADLDVDCASRLLRNWRVPAETREFLCRFATPQIESWLLADQHGIAAALSIDLLQISNEPDSIQNAKHEMIRLSRRSRSSRVRADMIPIPDQFGQVGPAYNETLIRFVNGSWDMAAAASRSESLARCLSAVHRFSA